MTPPPDDDPLQADRGALQQALADLLQPLAQLAVARGLPFADLQEALKRAFVQAATRAHPGLLPHRRVSRVSTVTGLNRREVTRLVQGTAAPAARRRSPATEVFAHWLSAREYRRADGAPRVQPRTGPAPSFETLAAEITRDVHPRSLLDELLRLKLAVLDPQRDTVALTRDAFVPTGDEQRMLGFLADNVGDHLRAAVENVLGGDRRHFEQAVFADGLSEQSLSRVREAVSGHWRHLLQALVPELEALVEADAKTPEAAVRRLRIGLYSFETRMDDSPAQAPAPAQAGNPAPMPPDPASPPRRARAARTEPKTRTQR